MGVSNLQCELTCKRTRLGQPYSVCLASGKLKTFWFVLLDYRLNLNFCNTYCLLYYSKNMRENHKKKHNMSSLTLKLLSVNVPHLDVYKYVWKTFSLLHREPRIVGPTVWADASLWTENMSPTVMAYKDIEVDGLDMPLSREVLCWIFSREKF